jgi:hypothetical protein
VFDYPGGGGVLGRNDSWASLNQNLTALNVNR